MTYFALNFVISSKCGMKRESLSDMTECEGGFEDKLSSTAVEGNGTVLYKSQVVLL